VLSLVPRSAEVIAADTGHWTIFNQVKKELKI
jgi:hypothetical protein